MSYDLQLMMIMVTAKFGDLIQFSYPIGYSHWALYDGDGYVVHFAVADENWATYAFRTSLETMLPSSGAILFGKTKIRRVHIREVKAPYGAQVLINNYHHSYVASHPWYIRQRVNALLGRQFTYDLFNLNCEHFATFLRYGRAICNQIPFKPKDEECVAATRVFRNFVMYKK